MDRLSNYSLNSFKFCRAQTKWKAKAPIGTCPRSAHFLRRTHTRASLEITLALARKVSFWTMASGRTLLEHDERQKPAGFFPKLYESLVLSVGEKTLDSVKDVKDDSCEVLKVNNKLRITVHNYFILFCRLFTDCKHSRKVCASLKPIQRRTFTNTKSRKIMETRLIKMEKTLTPCIFTHK